MLSKLASVFAILVFHTFATVAQQSFYSEAELKLLPQLRQRVTNILTQPYMQTNGYLIRFLRVEKLDLDAAEQLIKSGTEWRKAHNADTVRDFDWSSWEQIIPIYYTDNFHQGSPLLLSSMHRLDFKRILAFRKVEELRRYLIFTSDSIFQHQFDHLHNKTENFRFGVDIVFNLSNLNLRIHACTHCIQLYIELVKSYEMYYPQLVHRIIAINTPRLSTGLSQYLKFVLPPQTNKLIKVYGFDKTEWSDTLLKLYHKDQLHINYGGTGLSLIPISKLQHFDFESLTLNKTLKSK